MTAGRQGGAAEAAQRLWLTGESGHRCVTRQSVEALIAVCHVVEFEPTYSKVKVEFAWHPNEAVQYTVDTWKKSARETIDINNRYWIRQQKKSRGDARAPPCCPWPPPEIS